MQYPDDSIPRVPFSEMIDGREVQATYSVFDDYVLVIGPDGRANAHPFGAQNPEHVARRILQSLMTRSSTS